MIVHNLLICLENIYGNDSLSVSVILKNMCKDKELKKYFDNHPLP